MSDEEADNVIIGNFISRLPIPPNRVLNAAIDQLDVVLVIGIDNEGLDYFAASITEGKDLLWMVEHFKHKLLSGDFDATQDDDA